MRIVLATENAGKLKEVKDIMTDTGLEVVSMREAGLSLNIVEDGETFEENALIKARAITTFSNAIVLADDSGLEIDYLNKEPGVYSARYLGENVSYDEKIKSLLSRLEGVPDEKRTARFVCAIAAVFPDSTVKIVRGTIDGIITHEPLGESGFAYDSIMYIPELGKTLAQLDMPAKNRISHRGRALSKMKEYISSWVTV